MGTDRDRPGGLDTGGEVGAGQYPHPLVAQRGATGGFRYPLTDSYPSNGWHRQDFEGGSTFWSASSGSVTLPQPVTIAPREQRAADWAVRERNSSNPRWSDEFRRAWSGYCEGLVVVAFGTRGQFPSALVHYEWHRSRGRTRTDANPPIGVVVFHDGGAYGHAGVSIGNGQVVSSPGFGGQYLPVCQHSLRGLNNYLGWAFAPPHWRAG